MLDHLLIIGYWGSAAFIVYTLAGYVLFLGLVSICFPRRSLFLPQGKEWPIVTMVVCAYNEEKVITEKIESCRKIEYPDGKLEVLIVSDGSTDQTDELAKKAIAGLQRFRFLRVEGRQGKTECQNIAVRQSLGEVIVFSDADSIYHPDAVMKLVRNFVDPSVGGVTGQVRYIDPSKSSIGKSTIRFWEFELLIKKLQSRIHSLTGASGCIYAIRKNLYIPLPKRIHSDMVAAITIVRQGYMVKYEEEAIALERTTHKPKQEFNMRIRVVTGGMLGLHYMRSVLNPWRFPWISFQLVSHKILRWMLPWLMIGFLLSNLSVVGDRSLYTYTLLGQIILYLSALLGYLLDRRGRAGALFYLPYFFVLGNTAIAMAQIKILNGYSAGKWEPDREWVAK